MKWYLKLGLLAVLILALGVVALQNRVTVEVHFLWIAGEMPVNLLLFLTAATGIVVGILIALFVKGRRVSKNEKPNESD